LVPGGGTHSLAREGVGESQFRRGDLHSGTLYIYMYFVLPLSTGMTNLGTVVHRVSCIINTQENFKR